MVDWRRYRTGRLGKTLIRFTVLSTGKTLIGLAGIDQEEVLDRDGQGIRRHLAMEAHCNTRFLL